ncbi:MAG: phosphoglycerate kinase [Patescibacteria group bacterium]
MKLKTVRDIEVKGRRVLVRVDFNVSLKNGKVADNARIEQALPTIKYLLKSKAKVILLSHLGRPQGKVVEDLRLDPVARELEKLLKKKIKKANDCVGTEVGELASKLKDGEILLLENTRFHPEEQSNDSAFAKKLASLGDVFVQEAFGAVHRAHASVSGIGKILPTVAGLLLEKEVNALTKVFDNPQKPLVLVLGGAKIDTKIGVLRKFCELADAILLGGGLGNTFLSAEGFEVGESLYEENKLEIAQEIVMEALAGSCKIALPNDVICIDGSEEPSERSKTLPFRADAIPFSMKVFDIGERTRRQFSEIIRKAGTVIWNGPVGLFEVGPFASGTKAIAEACAETSATTILGGGDTVAALEKFSIPNKKFTHVSTGGGAMLEFLEGKQLPGLGAIKKA